MPTLATSTPSSEDVERRVAVLSALVGELRGRRVLVAGGGPLAARLLEQQPDELAACEVPAEPEGARFLPGTMAAGWKWHPREVVVLATGSGDVADPFPEIAAACRLATERVVAYFAGHDPARIERLFRLAGAEPLRTDQVPGGTVHVARPPAG
ncbi:MAG: NAD(P)-dependent oxidoreductase [Acidobacteriota bacterium]